jgi:UDP-2-acetamido-3-amino-2,3-dideoxy-glucuronate N-acetyltransferase
MGRPVRKARPTSPVESAVTPSANRRPLAAIGSSPSGPVNDAPYRMIDDVDFGDDVAVHSFVNLYGCRIGAGTRIGTFVEVQRGAEIGERCKIQSHSFICDGVRIGDGVFVGHGVTFINDRFPLATALGGELQTEADWNVIGTVVEDGASIGSGSTILCGVRIGARARVGAGAVVTRDVPAKSTVAGNPARPLGEQRPPPG